MDETAAGEQVDAFEQAARCVWDQDADSGRGAWFLERATWTEKGVEWRRDLRPKATLKAAIKAFTHPKPQQ
jgi:hypothetical protein